MFGTLPASGIPIANSGRRSLRGTRVGAAGSTCVSLQFEVTMFASVFHSLVIIPAVAFVIAAGSGIAIRARRAREDKRYRDLRFS